MSVNTNTNVVVVEQQGQPVVIGFFTFMLLAGIVAVAIQYWYIVVPVLATVFALWATRRAMAMEAQRKQALALRADYQHSLFCAGDPRGVYGDSYEGSQL